MIRTVILAGGYGTRVRHLLPGVPKPMAPVEGRPFVEWVVRFLSARGLGDFTLSTGYLSEVVSAHFDAQPVPGVNIRCRQEREPLGTAGGFLNCVDRAAPDDTTWLVVNGDSLIIADPRPLLDPVVSRASLAAVQGLRLPDTGRYGTLEVTPEGFLRAFREKQSGAGTVNAGVYAFSQATVLKMPGRRPLSFELDVLPELAATGQVKVEAVEAPFLDIGTPETLSAAGGFIAAHVDQFRLGAEGE